MLLPAFVLLLQAALPATPAALAPATPAGAVIDDSGTITVTATRLSDLAAAAAACAASPCPARSDVAVSVAYASALFDSGDYLSAKKILANAVGRVKNAAAAEPLAVSQLYNAQAALSMHEGDQRITEAATNASYQVLRAGLGDTALPTLTAGFRLAMWEVRVRRMVSALDHFSGIAETAQASGHTELANAARLQQAQVLALLNRDSDAFALLDRLAATDAAQPTAKAIADAAQVRRAALATAVRLASDKGDDPRATAYFARLDAVPEGDEPVLLSEPVRPKPDHGDPEDPTDPTGADRGTRGSLLTGLRWADIGYWVRPDGSIDDVAVLRGSRNRSWTPMLTHWLMQRRFAPSAGGNGVYRVERFSLTADYRTQVGSLIRRRSGNPRFESLPITVAGEAAQ